MAPVDAIRALLEQMHEKFLLRSVPGRRYLTAERDWKQCRFCRAYVDWKKREPEPPLRHSAKCPADALDPIREALEQQEKQEGKAR